MAVQIEKSLTDRLVQRAREFFPEDHHYGIAVEYQLVFGTYRVRAMLHAGKTYVADASIDEFVFMQGNFDEDLIRHQFQALSWTLHNYVAKMDPCTKSDWAALQPGVKEFMEIAGLRLTYIDVPVLGTQYWLVRPTKWSVGLKGVIPDWRLDRWQEFIAACVRAQEELNERADRD